MLSNMLLSFLKKKKKKKKDRGRIFQQRGRHIYARSGKNLRFWPAFCLSHPGLKLWKTFFSFGERNLRAQSKSRDSTNDGLTWRFLLVARHAATLGLWRAIPRVGNFPSWRDFPFELTNQSAFIFTGPQAQIPSSPYQQGLGLVRG